MTVEAVINARGPNVEGKKVSEILDIDYVAKIEASEEVKNIRHVKANDYVMNHDDAEAAAGTTMIQVFFTVASKEEGAAKEMQMRKRLYKIKQDDQYPDYWLSLASQYKGSLGVFE